MRDRRPPISTGFRGPRRPGSADEGRSVEPPPLFPEHEGHRHLQLVSSSNQATVTPLHPQMAKDILREEADSNANARCYMEPYPGLSGKKERLHRIRIWRRHSH